jgi:hypothetical protein
MVSAAAFISKPLRCVVSFVIADCGFMIVLR